MAGGRLVEFAGYMLPVQYKSVIAESKAVRDGAGMFDVSHMARLKFVGDEAQAFLDRITANNVAALEIGKGHYSLLPNENGGLVDDIIVYRTGEIEYRMVVNGANHEKDVAHIKSHMPNSVEFTDYTTATAMIAVQGPKAVSIVAPMAGALSQTVNDLPFFGVAEFKADGIDIFAARSGYTGEDGFELICSAEDAPKLWQKLIDAGVEPCGLGARDVLRVEAGLPLYGHELNDEINPISTGLGWVIDKEKEFLGSEHIARAREFGTPQKLQGIKMESKRIPHPDAPVFVGEEKVGMVTSGVFSPILDCGIGFAYLDSSVKLKADCEVEIRGQRVPGEVVSKRFYKRTQ